MYRITTVLLISALSGCASGCSSPSHEAPVNSVPTATASQESPAPSEQPATIHPDFPLSALEVLVRASIDLRGRRPSIAELKRVHEAPKELNTVIDGYLDDEDFPDRVADLYALALRSRTESYVNIPFEEESTLRYQVSVSEEPLMLIRHIARENLSYDEFLLADYTFANKTLAEAFPVEGYDEDAGGWQRVHYTDGRPAAGYISLGSTYMRYLSDDFNYNRGRANALSRILVCDDFLKWPIQFPRDIDLSDENAIGNAVAENPVCTACHDQLDPIASFLFAFQADEDGEYDAGFRSEFADQWKEATGKAPAYYGQTGQDVGDLARLILNDPRYARCAVTRVYEGLLERQITSHDETALAQHLAAFEAGGRSFKALYRSVVQDPVYRGYSDKGRPALAAKMLSPELLERVIRSLTGFQAQIEGEDLLRLEDGLRVLGGGLSALSGDYPSRTANVTRVLVQARIAESAATTLVQDDGHLAAQLFGDDDPGSEALEIATLNRIHQLILGRTPSDTERNELFALFDDLIEEGLSPPMVRAGLVSVLLRDPEFITY